MDCRRGLVYVTYKGVEVIPKKSSSQRDVDNLKVNKQYIKKFITLFVLLVVPLSLFMLYIYNNMLHIYMDQEINQNERTIQQLLNRTEENMNQLENLMLQISYESNLIQGENISRDEDYIIEQLLKYKLMNPLIHEIVLYYRGEDVLYTSQYATQLKSFINHYYPYKNWDSNDFYNEMNMVSEYHIKKKEIRDDEEYDEFITLIYPLTDTSSTTYGTLIVLVEEAKLYKIIEKLDKGSNIFILGEEDQLISTLNDVNYLTNYNYLSIMHHLINNLGYEITIDKEKKFIIQSFSEDINWRFVMLGSYESIVHRISQHFVNWSIIFLCILLSLFMFIIFIFEYHQKPMNNLLNQLQVYLKDYESIKVKDFKAIQRVFEKLHQDNDVLLNENKTYRVKNLLHQLLTTSLEKNQVMEHLEQLGIIFTQKYVGVAIIQSSNELTKEDVENRLRKDVLKPFVFESFIPYQYIIFYECSTELKVIIHELKALSSVMDTIEIIGVGRKNRKIGQIAKSYREAYNAILYFEYSDTKVVHFSDALSEKRISQYYPSKYMEQLCQVIQSGNSKETQNYLDIIQEVTRIHETPFFLLRSMTFDLLNRLYGQEEHDDSIHTMGKIKKLLKSSFKNKNEIWSVFSSIALISCNAFNKQRSTQDLVEQMRSYIDENFTNPNFSISMMSDYYAVSFSYTSRYFKEKLGITPQEYLQQCRMQEAQHLLLTTNMNLKNIAEHVGYYNVSSFIRMFKKYTQKTPGQYRAGAG